MKQSYIYEREKDMTYIELRIFMYVECMLKSDKITEIINFLNYNNFINNLTMFYPENIRSENVPEKQDIMSLSIDMRDDSLRFKFWNGASTLWLYHVEDLFDALKSGREKYSDMYDKYEPITEVLMDFKRRWNTSIYNISYKYYPRDDIDLEYNIVFFEEVKNTNYVSKILNKINKEIVALGSEKTNDLNFSIDYSFKTTAGCKPCEEAKRREQNEFEG